jgi:hypothetical protein
VDEAAAQVRAALADPETEVLAFEDDAPAEAVSDALLNRSLFSPRRLVQLDISRIVGTEAPGELFKAAVEAWEEGKRREAFRQARALLAALELPSSGSPDENAEAAARKTRRKDEAPLLAEILKELPPESAGAAAVLKAALRTVVAREHNDGTVALLTAVKPPAGVDLIKEIEKRGLILQTSVEKEAEPALRRLASARAKEREVVVEPAAIERLLTRTDGKPASFASELEKLLEWAGKGGRIRAADVETNVRTRPRRTSTSSSRRSAVARRSDALARLERLFEEGREVSAGNMAVDTIKGLAGQVPRNADERGAAHAADPVPPGRGRRPGRLRRADELSRPSRPASCPASWRRPRRSAARRSRTRRAAGASLRALPRRPALGPVHVAAAGRALARAAEVDTKLKDSAPVLETLTAYVGELIAGN